MGECSLPNVSGPNDFDSVEALDIPWVSWHTARFRAFPWLSTWSWCQKMQCEALIELIDKGRADEAEEVWMSLFESDERPIDQLHKFHSVLRRLNQAGDTRRAEALAWAAIESVSARSTPEETLQIAGPFLLAVGDAEELRKQVTGLYEQVHADVDGFSALLEEAGLAGGRPVRRALRTLEVALALHEGDYLVSRDDDGAARVEKIDHASWDFTVSTPDGTETHGAVHLADQYRPAAVDEFRVMQCFAPDELTKRLWSDPAAIVVDLCRQHNNQIDSMVLEETLVGDLLAAEDWKKWWTKARTGLRRSPNVEIEGRSPYFLKYIDRPLAPHGVMLTDFRRKRSPLDRLSLVERYVRECKVRGDEPDREALEHCVTAISAQAEKLAGRGASEAISTWAIALRFVDLGQLVCGVEGATEFFRTADNLPTRVSEIERDALVKVAIACIVKSRPDDWPDLLTEMLPNLILPACDGVVARLFEMGRTTEDFEPIIQQIMASPIQHFEALLWLWDGPGRAAQLPIPGSVTLISRIVRALGDCGKSDSVDRATAKRIGGRARAVLAARRYERFNSCLDELDLSMGRALTTQIKLLDNLGRAVRDDLLGKLNDRFPPAAEAPKPPWTLDDVIFVTKQSLQRKQAEIDQHVNVAMRDNAKAIGAAAEHGDLSENSEFKFALEERDLLRARLAQMNSEVSMARVMASTEVPTDHIGIGTEARFRNLDDGTEYILRIVSPWDADGPKNWVNYKAPLAQRVLGNVIGDQVEFTHADMHGTYELVELVNGLAADEL